MKTNLHFLLPCLMLFFAAACQDKPRFELLPATETGVVFQNHLEETPQMNVFTYLYFYNGGGVAAGDVNGDGLPDLYFTSNLDSNKLYLNKGNFKFVDVTAQAQVSGQKGWTTGVTMADVNGDGKLDIYVSQLGDYKNIRGKNQLYINLGNDKNGYPKFEDQASKWGLDLVGLSTQAAFFDYDLDGDLDMYMLNHSVHSNGTYVKSTIRKEVHPLSGDKLMRNDGDKFTDVTTAAGIYSSVLGYGLGVATGDVNWDGYPDIYVGNDFHENDYLYLNNGDGTFREQLESSMRHTSRYSMGNDIGDINNDGLMDIVSLDMLPADPVMRKTSAGEDAYDIYQFKLNFGYNHQFARNSLQLNLGNGNFSEIALAAGVSATDWSWSGLLADLDLDGYKDLFVSNGIKRRMNDLDYIHYISNEAIQHRLEGDLSNEDLALVEKMPVVKVPNYTFHNSGDLTFEDVSETWGLGQASFSNGAVYVDLDDDGDLDLVTNNIDQEAFIYRNNTINGTKRDNNYIKVRFEGNQPNKYGIGAKVIIPAEDGKIVNELYSTRGFQSAVNAEMIIGMGQKTQVDSLIVIWPDKSYQILQNIPTNQTLTLKQKEAQGIYDFTNETIPVFSDRSHGFSIAYKHQENDFIGFNREPLMPHMASTEGPKLAIGDINGDGRDDFFVGGAKRQRASVFVQVDTGFVSIPQEAFRLDSLNEDVGAEFVDVDKDQDLDLVVVSGGNEFQKHNKPLLVRLYKNNGKGHFSKDENALSGIYVTGSCVKAADFNQDGFPDLFIGGRVVPWNYGAIPHSYLLQNDGKGNFKDVTSTVAPDLAKAGMVKDAFWADLDRNGAEDLVLAGEWMPITIYMNENGQLNKISPKGLAHSNGWWNALTIADIDGDDDLDIIAGNLGLNSKLQATEEQPLTLYVKDFDHNGKTEQILIHYINGEKQLFATKNEIGKQLPSIKNKFLKYEDFAHARPNEVIPEAQLASADHLVAYELRSGVFINDGSLGFTFKPFPIHGQLSPLNSFHLLNFDQDGLQDILAAGNFYEVNVQLGRYDADYGTLLRNAGQGNFEGVPNHKSGLKIKGQVRDIQSILYHNHNLLLIALNNDSIRVVQFNKKSKALVSER